MNNKLTLILLITLALFQPLHASDYHFVPFCGASIPLGDAAKTWLTGYSVGLDVIPTTGFLGLRAGFNRYKPNAVDLLDTGDGKMHIERNIGWQATGELTALAIYTPVGVFNFLTLEVGPGAFYIRQSDIDLKGFYSVGRVAVGREISRPGKSTLAPGLTAGMSIRLGNQVFPTFRIKHIFDSDGVTSALLGIVIFPNW